MLRFGFEFVEEVTKLHNCKIEVIDHTEKTEQQELIEDLVQIISVFSCKLQEKRTYKAKELIEELLNDKDNTNNDNS